MRAVRFRRRLLQTAVSNLQTSRWLFLDHVSLATTIVYAVMELEMKARWPRRVTFSRCFGAVLTVYSHWAMAVLS
jgi:hypothetical protein